MPLKDWETEKVAFNFGPKPPGGTHESWKYLPIKDILLKEEYELTYHDFAGIFRMSSCIPSWEEFPVGFMDVISISYKKEKMRLMYDTKGRLLLHEINDEEAKFNLCKVFFVKRQETPYICIHDLGGRVYNPDPKLEVNDTVKMDLETRKIIDFAKISVGNTVMVTGGRYKGSVGVIRKITTNKPIDKDRTIRLVRIEDRLDGREFATIVDHVFPIGKGSSPWITLPN